MIEKYFDIHGLVKIKVQTNYIRKINSVLVYLREFEKEFIDDDDNIDILISDYSQRPHLKEYFVVTKYSKPLLFANNYLDSPYDQFCFNLLDRPLTIYSHSYCPLLLTFLIELILLEKNYSLIHAAAVEYNNKIYIFPAFPGIGKTTLVSSFLEHGAKLLGDDMVIINEDETLSFPIDFAIYPYHLDVFKIKNKKAIKKLNRVHLLQRVYDSKIGRSLVSAIGYILESSGFSSIEFRRMLELIKSSHARVPASEIFGVDRIAQKGRINQIFYLCRQDHSSSEIVIEEADASEIAEICTNIMMHEWSKSMPILTIYSGMSKFSILSLFSTIKNLFKKIFTQHECYKIKIPANIDNISIKKQIFEFIVEKS